MPLLHENSPVISGDASALSSVQHTSGYSRLIYGAYLTLGIVFYGIGIYTALGILMRSIDEGAIVSVETALLLCYVLLNGVIGYGFMFYRRWVLVVFSSILILKMLLAVFLIITSRGAALSVSAVVVVGILFFLFITKDSLSGSYFSSRPLIPFIGVLLCSFILANFGMLN